MVKAIPQPVMGSRGTPTGWSSASGQLQRALQTALAADQRTGARNAGVGTEISDQRRWVTNKSCSWWLMLGWLVTRGWGDDYLGWDLQQEELESRWISWLEFGTGCPGWWGIIIMDLIINHLVEPSSQICRYPTILNPAVVKKSPMKSIGSSSVNYAAVLWNRTQKLSQVTSINDWLIKNDCDGLMIVTGERLMLDDNEWLMTNDN